jgi:DNA polymerase-4
MSATGSDGDWWLLHVDLDQFLAAVEIRRRPELRGLPVVVGGNGDPSRPRQVVATASYEARAHGVHSGMPLRTAAKKCPHAVFLPADHAVYDDASAEVMEVVRSFGYPVEVWGWDEAVLGASTADPEALAADLIAAVLTRTKLTCAIGIGDTKERAKMATGFAKQTTERVFRLSRSNWISLMGQQDVEALWGIGRRTAARLAEHGLQTVAALADADPEQLAAWFGPTIGPRLRVLARGGSARKVSSEPWVPRSKSRQITYPEDLVDPRRIAGEVTRMADELCREVAADGRQVTHVGVLVRTATFFTQVKTGKLAGPTTDADVVAAGAVRVLQRFEITRPVRLLGVRLDLAPVGSAAPEAPVRPAGAGTVLLPGDPG